MCKRESCKKTIFYQRLLQMKANEKDDFFSRNFILWKLQNISFNFITLNFPYIRNKLLFLSIFMYAKLSPFHCWITKKFNVINQKFIAHSSLSSYFFFDWKHYENFSATCFFGFLTHWKEDFSIVKKLWRFARLKCENFRVIIIHTHMYSILLCSDNDGKLLCFNLRMQSDLICELLFSEIVDSEVFS